MKNSIDALTEHFNDILAEYNSNHQYPLSISYGYAMHNKKEDHVIPIKNIFKLADEAMYEDKQRKHAARE